MELFQNGLDLSAVVQNRQHQQQGLLLPEILTPASVLHPAALWFSWALLFSSQHLQMELIRCKNSSPLPPSSRFFFFFLSRINCLVWFITWTHKLLNQHSWGWHAATRWQKWTPRGDGSKERKGQTWARLLKLVLLLDALHLGNLVLAWVQGMESEYLNYKLPSGLWHP